LAAIHEKGLYLADENCITAWCNVSVAFSKANQHNANLFLALGQWGRSTKRAGDEQDQGLAGSEREKEKAETSPLTPLVTQPFFRSSALIESLEQANTTHLLVICAKGKRKKNKTNKTMKRIKRMKNKGVSHVHNLQEPNY